MGCTTKKVQEKGDKDAENHLEDFRKESFSRSHRRTVQVAACRPLEDNGNSMVQARQVGGAGDSLLLVLAHFSPSLLFLRLSRSGRAGIAVFRFFVLPNRQRILCRPAGRSRRSLLRFVFGISLHRIGGNDRGRRSDRPGRRLRSAGRRTAGPLGASRSTRSVTLLPRPRGGRRTLPRCSFARSNYTRLALGRFTTAKAAGPSGLPAPNTLF